MEVKGELSAVSHARGSMPYRDHRLSQSSQGAASSHGRTTPVPPPAPSQFHVIDPRFEPPAFTTVMVDGFNFFDIAFTAISRVTTCNDLWPFGPFGPRNGRIHGVNIGRQPEMGPTTGQSLA